MGPCTLVAVGARAMCRGSSRGWWDEEEQCPEERLYDGRGQAEEGGTGDASNKGRGEGGTAPTGAPAEGERGSVDADARRSPRADEADEVAEEGSAAARVPVPLGRAGTLGAIHQHRATWSKHHTKFWHGHADNCVVLLLRRLAQSCPIRSTAASPGPPGRLLPLPLVVAADGSPQRRARVQPTRHVRPFSHGSYLCLAGRAVPSALFISSPLGRQRLRLVTVPSVPPGRVGGSGAFENQSALPCCPASIGLPGYVRSWLRFCKVGRSGMPPERRPVPQGHQ